VIARSLGDQLGRLRKRDDDNGNFVARSSQRTAEVLLIEHPRGDRMQLPGAAAKNEIARAAGVSAPGLRHYLVTQPLPTSWWVLADASLHCFRCVWLPLTEAARHVEGLPDESTVPDPDTTRPASRFGDGDSDPHSHYLAWHGRWFLQRWLPGVT